LREPGIELGSATLHTGVTNIGINQLSHCTSPSKGHAIVAEPPEDVSEGVTAEPLYARVNKRTTSRLIEHQENIYAFCDKVRKYADNTVKEIQEVCRQYGNFRKCADNMGILGSRQTIWEF
jgi:hypothetical protein